MKTLMNIPVILMFSLAATEVSGQQKPSFYDYTVTTLDGKEFPLSQLKGKKVLVVNTASKCGFTPQYAALEALYQKYGGDKFVIIGFPANNFLRQEPGTNAEIKEFCTRNYGVTFPMMSKISVKGGDQHPLYNWLTSKKLNGVADAKVTWNFQKFLIDEQGHWVATYPPAEKPDSPAIVKWIEGK
jgi:glutathione peroxidase